MNQGGNAAADAVSESTDADFEMRFRSTKSVKAVAQPESLIRFSKASDLASR
jgi:hypothetical protein